MQERANQAQQKYRQQQASQTRDELSLLFFHVVSADPRRNYIIPRGGGKASAAGRPEHHFGLPGIVAPAQHTYLIGRENDPAVS